MITELELAHRLKLADLALLLASADRADRAVKDAERKADRLWSAYRKALRDNPTITPSDVVAARANLPESLR